MQTEITTSWALLVSAVLERTTALETPSNIARSAESARDGGDGRSWNVVELECFGSLPNADKGRVFRVRAVQLADSASQVWCKRKKVKSGR